MMIRRAHQLHRCLLLGMVLATASCALQLNRLSAQEAAPKPPRLLDLQGPEFPAEIRCGRAADWKLELGGKGEPPQLVLHRSGTYDPPHRSPRGIAILPVEIQGDFRFRVEIMHRGEETAHRDAVLVFGWESAASFHYAHLATRADDHAHHLQTVASADRTPFTGSRTQGVDWGRSEWREVVLERKGDRVSVFFDGAPSPVLQGKTKAFMAGRIGLGSFDDRARFRNLRIEAASLREDLKFAAADFGEALTSTAASEEASDAPEWIAGRVRRISSDGGWCWFEGPRAFIQEGELFLGSVASGWLQPDRRGDVDLHRHQLASRRTSTIELADRLERDDHNQPALLPLADGRLLSAYSKHGSDAINRVRRSYPGDFSRWEPEARIRWGKGTRPTYSNLAQLSEEGGRIYNFFRGLDGKWKPSWTFSDDSGLSWQRGGILIDVPATERHRPYAVYADDGRRRIHVAYTEGHPRNFNNSVYHVFVEKGTLRNSAGELVAPLERGLASPQEGQLIFKGSADAVAWVTDMALGSDGRPRVLFTVQRGSAGLPPGQGGDDHRFHWAVFDGKTWQVEEIAFGGRRLYAGEDDYTGLGSLDPADPSRVVISTDVDPSTGRPLVEKKGAPRVHELFSGQRTEKGWQWRPLTRHSTADHLRPICVHDLDSTTTWVAWLRGKYRTYQDYRLEVLATDLAR